MSLSQCDQSATRQHFGNKGMVGTEAGFTQCECAIQNFLTARTHYPGRLSGAFLHDKVAESPYLELVHQDRGLSVYQVNDKGRTCATAS